MIVKKKYRLILILFNLYCKKNVDLFQIHKQNTSIKTKHNCKFHFNEKKRDIVTNIDKRDKITCEIVLQLACINTILYDDYEVLSMILF